MKVAYYSPLPPERSGIADYSALLLPALQERVDITVVTREMKPPQDTDVALYHVGNNPEAHGWIVEALRQRRGVVVLHDFVLHHLVAGLTLGQGDREGYLLAMQRDAGVAGRLLAHGVVDHLVPPIWEHCAQDFPLAAEVLDHADGVICHSRFVKRLARDYGYTGPISVVPHPAWRAIELGARVAPKDRSPVIACVGYLNAAKRVPQLLEAFRRMRRRFPDALLVLAGAVAADVELDGGTPGDGVLHLDHLAERDLWQLLADCDVCVSLRWPTMGETSGIVIRALSLGKPLVVSDVGWFSELPESVAAKVPVDAYEVGTLTRVFELLADNANLRTRMGSAALKHAQREHDLERVADLYFLALEEMTRGQAVRDAMLGDVARAAREVGISGEYAPLSDVAASVRELGLGC